jgi:uncharacterized membrane protein
VIVLMLVVGVASTVLCAQLPERLPTHWNVHGQVDAYGDRAWAAFLMPLAMVAMLCLFTVLP